jgi:hypothetical protein
VYDHYSHPQIEFEVVYKKSYTTEPSDESDQRNQINYVPFQGFGEILNGSEMVNFKKSYFAAISNPPVGKPLSDYLISLQALATDPDFQYFARAALRCLLVADILKRFAGSNIGLRTEWETRIPMWGDFALQAFSATPENFIEAFPHMLR